MINNTINSSSSFATRLAAANAANTAVNLKDYIGVPLQIVDIVQSESTFVSDDGETVNCIQTILIDANGCAYRTYFGGVARSVDNIVAAFPDMNAPVGLTLTLREIAGNNGPIRYLEVAAG